MKKMIFCLTILMNTILPAFAVQGSVPADGVKRAVQYLEPVKIQIDTETQKKVDGFTNKVFKNTIHSVEGSSLKIGRIIALFIFCGLGAIVLLFALI